VFGFIAFFILGVVGVATLIGSVLLFATVASDAFSELAGESEEKAVTEKFIAGNRNADEKIAVITIDGVIISNADSFIAKQIRRVVSDTKVKAVVLRVDSPGGTMTGSDYYLYLLKKMKSERKIPVVVSMGSIAASGGYYVSMVGDEIYAEPATLTGSIGVIASLFDASELCKNIGITSTPVVSGKHKAMGSIMKPMSDEEKAIWQDLIDDNFDRFKEIIREGRKEFKNNPEELDKLATGQIYTANDAVANKLIDKIGFLDDAISQAGKLGNMNERNYKVVQYKPKLSVMDSLLESRVPNKLLSGKTLSEITTPKVYLLCPYVLPVDGEE
jgi:protease-4